jgi:hypothetical protein
VTGNLLTSEFRMTATKDSVIISMLLVVLMQKVGRRSVYYPNGKADVAEFFLVFKNYQGDSGSRLFLKTRDQR